MSSIDFQYQQQLTASGLNTTDARAATQNIGFTRQTQTVTFQADPEVSNLNDQIDEIEEKIATLKSDMKKKTSQYESEIANLQNEVEKKRIEMETEISGLREQHVSELSALRQQQEEELAQQQAHLDNTHAQRSNFSQRHQEALRTRKEAEITELRNILETKKIKYNEQNFDATTSTQQGKMEQQQREAELSAQIEILDNEINEIASSRNEELQRSRVKIDETSAVFDARRREQKIKIDRYNEEIQKRTVQYEDQIKAIEAQKKIEKEQLDNELKATNERLQGLQQLYTKMEKRNTKELNLAQQDIEKLKEAIDRAKTREEEQIEEAKAQIAKMQDAQNDNLAIEEEIEAVKQEILQIKKDNADMRKERQRLDNMIYSTRLSKHRSTLK